MTEKELLMRSVIGRRLMGIGLAGNILWISFFDEDQAFHDYSLHISVGFRIEINGITFADALDDFSSFDSDEVFSFNSKMKSLIDNSVFYIKDIILLEGNHFELTFSNNLRIFSYSEGYQTENEWELWRLFRVHNLESPRLIATPCDLQVLNIDIEEYKKLDERAKEWCKNHPDHWIAKIFGSVHTE